MNNLIKKRFDNSTGNETDITDEWYDENNKKVKSYQVIGTEEDSINIWITYLNDKPHSFNDKPAFIEKYTFDGCNRIETQECMNNGVIYKKIVIDDDDEEITTTEQIIDNGKIISEKTTSEKSNYGLFG